MLRLALFAGSAVITHGIVIRADKQDSDYAGKETDYPQVFAYPLPHDTIKKKGGNCAATLIGPKHAITAAHCFVGAGVFQPPFKATLSSGKVIDVTAVKNNKCFAQISKNGADIAILTIKEDTGVTPITFYGTGDPKGKTIQVLGWGDSKKAPGKAPADGVGSGTFRVGENIVDELFKHTVQYSLSDPADADTKPLPLEAIAQAGDSGGPTFIVEDGKKKLIGVNSGGSCCEYGSKDQYAYVSSALAQAWIKAVVAGETDDNKLPYGEADCSSWNTSGAATDSVFVVFIALIGAYMM